ncbi:hypothetical protein GQ457_08G004150 [Hibiscus cannabinus]
MSNMKSLPPKEKIFDMSTAEKPPGGQTRTVPRPETLQREQKRETQQGRKPKLQGMWLENRNAWERSELEGHGKPYQIGQKEREKESRGVENCGEKEMKDGDRGEKGGLYCERREVWVCDNTHKGNQMQ